MERKFPPGRLQGAPGLPLLNLEKPIQYAQKTDPRADGLDGLVGAGECPRVVVPGVEHPLPLLEADAAARRVAHKTRVSARGVGCIALSVSIIAVSRSSFVGVMRSRSI